MNFSDAIKKVIKWLAGSADNLPGGASSKKLTGFWLIVFVATPPVWMWAVWALVHGDWSLLPILLPIVLTAGLTALGINAYEKRMESQIKIYKMKISQINTRKIAIGMLLFIAGVLLLCLTSCSAEKRIARILKRHPELIKTDTIWKRDTIITEGAAKDSSFHFYQTDTVVLKKDNLTVKYYFNHDSTVYLSGTCDPDTIIKMYPVQVNSVEVKRALTWKERVKLWLWDNGWWILIILWILWKIFGKIIKTYMGAWGLKL